MMTLGKAVKYKSSMDALSRIINNDGAKSLFKGVGANILRAIADKLQSIIFSNKYGLLKVIGPDCMKHKPAYVQKTLLLRCMRATRCYLIGWGEVLSHFEKEVKEQIKVTRQLWNSYVKKTKEPWKHVFHVVTYKMNATGNAGYV
ncbi:ADP,ATP carrier protein 1, mitochondrial-like protein, partial [Tanacetum coccineum]